MVQTSYTATQPVGSIGELASPDRAVIRARTYPQVAHQVVVPVGGTTDGTYTIRVANDETGETFDASFAASGSTADQIVAGLAAALNDGTTTPNLRNVLTAEGSAADDDVTLTAVHKGKPFTVSFPSNPGTNLTQSTAVEADRSALPIGVALARTSVEGEAQPPGAATAEAQIDGLLIRSPGMEGPLDGSDETIPVGYTMNVLEEGDAFVMPEEDVTHESEVWIRRSASGSEKAGALRASADGSAEVYTVTPSTGDETYALRVAYAGKEHLAVVTDAAALTATQICNGLRDSLPSIDGLTFGGTATLTITTDAGTALDEAPHDVEGTLAVAETTEADVEAIRMTRWRWLSAGGPTSGSVAKLHVAK